jgi:hypothetical protein
MNKLPTWMHLISTPLLMNIGVRWYNNFMDEKKCSKCKKPQDRETDFYPNKRWKDGLHPWCKTCFNAAGKARYEKKCVENPPHHRWNRDLVRHSYFAHVDTPLQAYILGFLAADGNIDGKNLRISLELSVKDSDVLTFIRDELAPGHNIHTRNRKTSANRFGSGESVQFAFTSVEMIAHLARFGIIPRKTLIMRWPSILPSHLAPTFLLGYFDGDGNITQTIVKDTAYPIWNLTSGSIDFLRDIIAIVKEHIGISIGGPYRKGVHSYTIRVTGKKAVLLDEWLHASGLGLARKRL